MKLFIYGMSGAGKDTVSNYLRDSMNFLKFRIAGTIKSFVFEVNGFSTQGKFEYEKRHNPEIRELHHKFGGYYLRNSKNDVPTHLNRLRQLINRESMEFDIIPRELRNSVNICISDVRMKDEIEVLLENNFCGIFLTKRNTDEFTNKKHKTEKDIFKTNFFDNLDPETKSRLVIIDNGFVFPRMHSAFKGIPIFRPDCVNQTPTADELIKTVLKALIIKLQTKDA